MLQFINNALLEFRPLFSRHRSWLLFSATVLSFMASPEMIGVTSICRFWLCGESGYNSLLHVFRSKAYDYNALVMAWQRFVMKQGVAIIVNGRCLLLGDHTYVVKDGGRMPGVVSLHQHSETQHKLFIFRGQCWGAICLVVGSMSASFGMPVDLKIHQGFIHLLQDTAPSDESKVALAERVVQMALGFAVYNDRPAFLVLDAYFSVGSVFKLANSVYSVALKQPYLVILTRAKKNYVAYFQAPEKPSGRPGPQAKYGDKIYLMEVFDHLDLFKIVDCRIYGKIESIQLYSLPLLWRPLGDWVLFIFAITSRGPIVLMSSDLSLSPTTAIELYCLRSRIEVMFDVLKNLLGAFQFRFWTSYLPQHARCPLPNKKLKAPKLADLPNVQACWQAYEVFVLCAAIAQGLLQLIGLKFSSLIWEHHVLYLRTKSRELPSEKTVRQVLAPSITRELFTLPANSIIAEIRRYFMGPEVDEDQKRAQAA